jgi:hypothetical protein
MLGLSPAQAVHVPERTAHRFALRLLALSLVTLGMTVCAESATDPDSQPAESLIGIWTSTVPDVSEISFEFEDGQEFTAVYADYVNRRCTSESGVWSVADGSLTLQVATRNGQLVSGSVESVSYERSGNTLTIASPLESAGTYGPASSMPICADYGWMNMVMSAEIDGVATDFSTSGLFVIDLGSSIASGFVSLSGYYDPDGVGFDPTCATCQLLNIDVYHELGAALEPGTYPVETFGPTGNRAVAQYTPSFGNPTGTLGTNDSDPNTQPWSGQVLVTTMTPDLAEGTFEFVVFDTTGSGPPYPSVTITNGSFRLAFD